MTILYKLVMITTFFEQAHIFNLQDNLTRQNCLDQKSFLVKEVHETSTTGTGHFTTKLDKQIEIGKKYYICYPQSVTGI